MNTHAFESTPETKTDWRPLAAVLLLALVARLTIFGVAWYRTPDFSSLDFGDSITYIEPAQSLLADHEFSRGGKPELLRTPGYPLLLTVGLAAGHMQLVTVALQTLFGLVTVWVVYRLTQSLTGSRTATIGAAVLMAIEPVSVIFTSFIATETLFTALVVLMIAALTAYDRSNSLVRLAIAAALLAAAAFVRPIAYYLPPVIAMALVGRGLWRHEARLRGCLAAALFLIVAYVPLAAWQARNWSVAGYSKFAAISDWNLYYFQGGSILAQQKHQSLQAIQDEMGGNWEESNDKFLNLHPELLGASQAEVFRYMHDEGSRLVRQHPLEYAKIHLRGVIQLLVNPGAADFLKLMNRFPERRGHEHQMDAGILAIVSKMHRETPVVLYTNLLLAIVPGLAFAAAALGLVAGLRRWNWPLTLVVLIAGYFVALSGGPTAMARLRHPIMPLACVLSGVGVAVLAGLWARYRASVGVKSHRHAQAIPLEQVA